MKKRKDGLWQKSIVLPGGKRKFFYSHEETEKKAEKDIQHQMLNFKEVEEKGKFFAEVADEWEDEHYKNIEYNTKKQYKPAVNDAKTYFCGRYIKSITNIDCQQYINYIAAGKAKKTVISRLLVLNMIFKYAVLNQYIPYNACQYVSVPKGLKKEYRAPASEQDIERIKSNIDIPFGLYAYFILYTGCRRNEACALRVGDIDFKNKFITINKSIYTADDNKVYIKSPKTERGVRKIILTDNLYKILKKHLKGKKRDDLVFPNKDGEYISDGQFDYWWRKYQEQTGVTATPHQIRHSYATMLYNAGVTDKDAQDLLGHTTLQMTRDLYTHITAERKEQTATKLNSFISEKTD